MVSILNPKADTVKSHQALSINASGAKSLQDIMKSNLGPKGTLKLLVGGAGQLKLTKDGGSLLKEMQIQHPTASMIARCAAAQDDICGDGTTSLILLVGELLRRGERLVTDERYHPRVVAEGYEKARVEILNFLETFAEQVSSGPLLENRDILHAICQVSLRTKLHAKLADQLAPQLVDAVLAIHDAKSEFLSFDLHMIEIMHIRQHFSTDSRLVRGLVMDHGSRHSDMPKRLENCYILVCNVSLEYEKSEVHSGFFYSSAEQREKLVHAERKVTDDKVNKIIQLKREVCTPENGKTFVLFNQKGIDPPSLELLAKEGIIGLRRLKRRNMERVVKCCGGSAVNSVDDLSLSDLGNAGVVYEEVVGEDKFTFVEKTPFESSCTLLIQGPNDHSIAQVKEAIRDGLRCVKNTIEDNKLLPGAGAFELAAHRHLMNFSTGFVDKTRMCVQSFAESMLIVPKTLLENSGFDVVDSLVKVQQEVEASDKPVGMDIYTGGACSPSVEGLWDNYVTKRQMLEMGPTLASQLMLVDEIVRAGVDMGKN